MSRLFEKFINISAIRLSLIVASVALGFLNSSPINASELIYCEHLDRIGLFEQCHEVKLMKESGSRVHVYAYSSKKLFNVPMDSVFEILPILEAELHSQSKVLIPGSLIWSGAKPRTQSLCEVESIKSKGLAQVHCSGKQSFSVKTDRLKKLGNSYSDRKSKEHFVSVK